VPDPLWDVPLASVSPPDDEPASGCGLASEVDFEPEEDFSALALCSGLDSGPVAGMEPELDDDFGEDSDGLSEPESFCELEGPGFGSPPMDTFTTAPSLSIRL
jgi:hypothetical protein